MGKRRGPKRREVDWAALEPMIENGDNRNTICKKTGLDWKSLARVLEEKDIKWIPHGKPIQGKGHYEFHGGDSAGDSAGEFVGTERIEENEMERTPGQIEEMLKKDISFMQKEHERDLFDLRKETANSIQALRESLEKVSGGIERALSGSQNGHKKLEEKFDKQLAPVFSQIGNKVDKDLLDERTGQLESAFMEKISSLPDEEKVRTLVSNLVPECLSDPNGKSCQMIAETLKPVLMETGEDESIRHNKPEEYVECPECRELLAEAGAKVPAFVQSFASKLSDSTMKTLLETLEKQGFYVREKGFI